MLKKAISILAVLALLTGLFAGCGGSAEPSDGDTSTAPQSSGGETQPAPEMVSGTSDDETLTIALALEPPTLMPTASNSKEAGVVINCMAEPLLVWDAETGDILPCLAESYEWVDDTHFRLKIREGVYFHNGEELTAEDVLFSLEVQYAMTSGSSIYNVPGYVLEDRYSLVCETDGVWVQAPENYARTTNIYSKTVLEAQGGVDLTDLTPIDGHGTGKYKFVEWVQGQYILIERNDDYWNQDDLPYYKYMKFVFVNDSAARAMAVESGDADIGSDLPCSQAAAYAGVDSITPHFVDTYMAGVVFMNMNNPTNPDSPLKNVLVREAIWHLIDVDALNQLSADGRGTPNETTISPASIVYDPPPAGYERKVDVDRAKELLAEAGYPDGFSLTTTNIPTYAAQLEIVQENLRLAGIDLEITINETPSHFQLLRAGEYDMIFSSLNAMNYTENLRLIDGRISHASVSGGAGNIDESIYPLLDRAYAAFDMDERIEIYKEAQEYMRENYTAIGTHTTIRLELSRSGLSAPVVNAAGTVDYTAVRPIVQ